MASDKLAIHVFPDANPSNTTAMIKLLSSDSSLRFSMSKDLVEYLKAEGISASDFLQNTSTHMGVLEKSEGEFRLSELGNALARIREDVRGDLFHLLLYSGWDANDPTTFLQSWGYRTCCNRYWTEGEVQLTSVYLDRQVEETIAEARETFTTLNIPEFDEVSFSRRSLTGVHKWLLGLQPQVLFPNVDDAKDRTFRRRDFCPPELVVLALAWVLRDETSVTGVEILLTREKREALCKACLLSPEALDRVLDWAIPTFPSLISPGTRAGAYGRFVRLHKIPTVEDVIR
jgi:hypothetical protein